MNLSFEEALHGLAACAGWAGQDAVGQQVAGGFRQLHAAYPQIAPQIAAMVINTYTGIVTKHGVRIARDGVQLPGYVPAQVAVTPTAYSDADLLRILRPYYEEFIASHAG